MSNILIIKHGSLGDIAQVSGAIQDIKANHINDKIYCLTTPLYYELLKKCPFIDEVLIDPRISRLNILYLLKLKKKLNNLNFLKIYDLQNSSRTSFYKRFIITKSIWSSTETTLPKDKSKEEFDEHGVLERFNYQLLNSGIKTKNTMNPNFSWACDNVDFLKQKFNLNKYLLLFPFSSSKLSHKRWPYYNKLIDLINLDYKDITIITAPGPLEILDSKNINATAVLNNNKSISISQLAGLIKDSIFVISNDTGPAHITAHLNKSGIVLFGHHTSSSKVSIETKKLKAINVDNLNNLSAEKVYFEFQNKLRVQ